MQKASLRHTAAACALFLATAFATQVSATELTTVAAGAVRIQNYNVSNITLYYTGSVCTSGGLILDATDPQERHNQLLATALAAKAAGAKLTFEYDVGGGQCVIRNFSVDGP